MYIANTLRPYSTAETQQVGQKIVSRKLIRLQDGPSVPVEIYGTELGGFAC